MQVIILAGGFGTRLSEETSIVPKPMIEVGNRPILWHLMHSFSTYNYNEFIVALGYKSEVIKRYFLHFSELHSNLEIDLADGTVDTEKNHQEDWKISLVDTGGESMTGGRLFRLRDKIKGRFIFTYGDGLSNIDINKLVEFHFSHGKLATVTAVKPVSRYGLLRFNDSHQVCSFAEKPDYGNELINGGFFVLEPSALDFIEGDQTTWEAEPMERLANEGQLNAFKHAGFWQPMDTLRDRMYLEELWNAGNAPWKKW